MWRSLRTRLLLATFLVVLIAVGVTAVVARQRTLGEFELYQERRPPIDMRRMGYVLAHSWAENDGWGGIQSDIDKLAQLSGQRVVVANAGEVIVGDSDNRLVGQPVDTRWKKEALPVAVDGRLIGYIFLDPQRTPVNAETTFLQAVNRSVLYGALAAGLAALIVTFVLSGGIVRPIQRLTDAAEQMKQGDLAVRVPDESRDEIGRLAAAFNSMAGGLAEQETLRRHMVGDVAHELRTPLTNLRGYLEAVRDGLIEPDAALVDNLYEETMLLSRLVSDLQELAQAEAGQLQLERRPSDLNAIVDRAVTMSRPQAEASGIILNAAIAQPLPPVEVDQERIGQVLRNLLNNAVAHTPAGGRITIAAEPRGDEILISVTDTGSGIPAEHLPRVFDRFYRVDRSRARNTGGAGLGLAIVRQLVVAHGGRIWAESTEGQGSTFTFTLPTHTRL